jgi:hypothetical protein
MSRYSLKNLLSVFNPKKVETKPNNHQKKYVPTPLSRSQQYRLLSARQKLREKYKATSPNKPVPF